MSNLDGAYPEVLRLVVCPACKAALTAEEGAAAVSLRCTGCRRIYPIVDGIPILLLDRSRPAPEMPE